MQFFTLIAAIATVASADYQAASIQGYNPSLTIAAPYATAPSYAAPPAQSFLAGAQATNLYSSGRSCGVAVAVVATVATFLF
ncbi:hypothetical protein HDU78_004683 [Chytriomyces hyalinus]|nr:hypothetical protein HDU78_004683 [Chytriomyces hyalinus]